MVNKVVVVTCVADLIEPLIKTEESELEFLSFADFIDRYVKSRYIDMLPQQVYIHLYEESKDYPFHIKLRESMIYDPMESKLSDILCGIIFAIANREDDGYFRELLGRTAFISQNTDSCYRWGKDYFQKLGDEYCIQLKHEGQTALPPAGLGLKFDEEKMGTVVDEMYQVLKKRALYFHR